MVKLAAVTSLAIPVQEVRANKSFRKWEEMEVCNSSKVLYSYKHSTSIVKNKQISVDAADMSSFKPE